MLFHSRSVHQPLLLSRVTDDPSQDIKGDWKKLGSGSFGNVYKGALVVGVVGSGA